MFEPVFLGQVRLGQAPAQGTPQNAPGAQDFSPSRTDGRESEFSPLSLNPFMVPFMRGYTYPPNYPPDRFDCTLNEDGLSWTCTPKAVTRTVAPVTYPVVPFFRY